MTSFTASGAPFVDSGHVHRWTSCCQQQGPTLSDVPIPFSRKREPPPSAAAAAPHCFDRFSAPPRRYTMLWWSEVMRCPLRCCDQSASSGTIDNVRRRQDEGDVWSIRSIPLKRNLRQHPSYLNISYSNILISLFSAVSSLKNRKQNIIFADALCHHPGHSRYMHSDIPRISAKGRTACLNEVPVLSMWAAEHVIRETRGPLFSPPVPCTTRQSAMPSAE